MQISEKSISRLITDRLVNGEGYRQFAYDDATGLEVKAPVGKLSIGMGWNLQDVGCSLDIAKYVSSSFIRQADYSLNHKFVWYEWLDEVRKCVLIEMVFNMGFDDFLMFKKTIHFLSLGLFRNAGIEMRNSRWYRQVTRRAESLCVMMETGEWNKFI